MTGEDLAAGLLPPLAGVVLGLLLRWIIGWHLGREGRRIADDLDLAGERAEPIVQATTAAGSLAQLPLAFYTVIVTLLATFRLGRVWLLGIAA